jgi:hypothetical protein
MNVIVIEVERRPDGRRYPPGGTLPERERWRAINLAHQFHCAQQLTFKATQAALAQAGIRRSIGQIHKDIVRYACDVCDVPGRQPGRAADRQQPARGAGWAGPAPSW